MKILSKLSQIYGFQVPSFCDGRPMCVAEKQEGEVTLVADSKNPDQAALEFTPDEWKPFIKGVKNNEFDY